MRCRFALRGLAIAVRQIVPARMSCIARAIQNFCGEVSAKVH